MEEFTAWIEYLPECPVHSGGVFHEVRKFSSLAEIKEHTLKNINEYHIVSILSSKSDDIYTIEYVPDSHMYVGIILKKNNEIIARTIEDEDINLVWRSVDGDN